MHLWRGAHAREVSSVVVTLAPIAAHHAHRHHPEVPPVGVQPVLAALVQGPATRRGSTDLIRCSRARDTPALKIGQVCVQIVRHIGLGYMLCPVQVPESLIISPAPRGMCGHLGRSSVDFLGNVQLKVRHLASALRAGVLALVRRRTPLAGEIVKALLGDIEELNVVSLVPVKHCERPERVLMALFRSAQVLHPLQQHALGLLVKLPGDPRARFLRMGSQHVSQRG